MNDRWRSSRLWVAVTVVAVIGAGAAILKAFGWDWPWLVAAIAAVGAVFALPAKLWITRLEGAAKRFDERTVTLQAGALGGGRRWVRDYLDPTGLGVHRAVLPERVAAAADLPAQVSLYVRAIGARRSSGGCDRGHSCWCRATPALARPVWPSRPLRATLPAHRLLVPERTALAAAGEDMAGIRHRWACALLRLEGASRNTYGRHSRTGRSTHDTSATLTRALTGPLPAKMRRRSQHAGTLATGEIVCGILH